MRSLIAVGWENMQISPVQVNLGRTASGLVADPCTDEVDRILEQIRRYRQSGRRFYGPSAGDLEEQIMTRIVHGIVHGRTIELNEDPGVPEGQDVEVQIKVIAPPRKWGDGILRTAGALADDPHWDAIMEEVHQARKIERRPQTEDK
jgi:hypothetical protein